LRQRVGEAVDNALRLSRSESLTPNSAVHFDGEFRLVARQAVEVGAVIGIGAKRSAPLIAAYNDVVEKTARMNSRSASHGAAYHDELKIIKK
jgi:hypothetical protein